MNTLNISEIFYSLQGEGVRTGEPTIFIRLSGCSAKHACFASGVVCDTEFESGEDWSVEQILDWIKEHAPECQNITWTGGEPLDQLNDNIDILEVFHQYQYGFFQTVETSGLKVPPDIIDFVSLSPKIAQHAIKTIWKKAGSHFYSNNGANRDMVIVDEIRYVRHAGQPIPKLVDIAAEHLYISPMFDGMHSNWENIRHCIDLCMQNPQWSLSLQTHKLIEIL